MKKGPFIVGGLIVAVIVVLFLVFSSNEMLTGDVVTYSHHANSGESSQDCFDAAKSVCLTRGAGGTVYNVGDGEIEIGWGKCDNVGEFYNLDKDGWRAIKSNFDGAMSNLVNHDLCFSSNGVGKWDVVFSIHQGGSKEGTFEYTRVRYS